MPICTSLAELRVRLAADPGWCVYALGDLAPGYFERSEWHVEASGEPALLLLFRAFKTPVLFTLGTPAALGALLDEIAGEPALYLSIRPEVLPLAQARWRVTQLSPMWRMVLAPGEFRPPAAVANQLPIRLTPNHLAPLEALYADGAADGEAPDFFEASMVRHGAFYGVFEGGALISAAGTHLIAAGEGVAAVGNVYTRRDRRGRGLAAQVTGAVVADLLASRSPLGVVALNVRQTNLAAQRVYEQLGFRRYCAFYEGLAEHA